jgi:TolB-like protein/Tfp pilus assembly protein PilF
MSFLAELKRRNVIRMAGLYLVGAWLITQVASTVFPAFNLPDWALRGVILLLAIGFIPALVISWVFELTPEGLKRDSEVPNAESIAPQTARRMDRMIIVVLLLALGYFAFDKFVLAPGRVATAAPVVKSETAKTPAAASIAVLPFADMSQAKDQEYFSDGLSEEILNLLAQIRDLKVIGRTSSFAFKGRNEDLRTIGNTLGVAYLLEGSVRKAGTDLRITAQLIEVEGGSHLWSQSYNRKLENVFAIQTEIAASIAQALKINLLDAGQSAPVAQVAASLPAYDLFLQARRLIQSCTRGGLEAARGLLDEALKLDPDYAPALAAQAQTVSSLQSGSAGYGDIPLDQALAIAQPLLDKALALDPTLAEAHAVQSLIFFFQRDFARAEASLARALALNPNLPDALHWQAGWLESSGRLRESLAVRQRLDAIDPLNVGNLWSLGGRLRDGGKWVEAQAVTARMLRTFPDSPQTFGAQAFDLLNAGRLAEAQIPAGRMLALKSNWAALLNARIYYLLGDFEKMLSLPGLPKAQPLLALGRLDEAAAAARERFAAAPEDRDAAEDLLTTLSSAGRFDELLRLYRERWRDLEALDTYFGPIGKMEPLLSIATAQRAQGQQQALAETLTPWRKRLDFQREQGYASGAFVMTEARYFALADDRAAAVKALTRAIDLGVRDPLLGRDPAFAELRDDPEFKAQNARMITLINIERAKLNMAPLP